MVLLVEEKEDQGISGRHRTTQWFSLSPEQRSKRVEQTRQWRHRTYGPPRVPMTPEEYRLKRLATAKQKREVFNANFVGPLWPAGVGRGKRPSEPGKDRSRPRLSEVEKAQRAADRAAVQASREVEKARMVQEAEARREAKAEAKAAAKRRALVEKAAAKEARQVAREEAKKAAAAARLAALSAPPLIETLARLQAAQDLQAAAEQAERQAREAEQAALLARRREASMVAASAMPRISTPTRATPVVSRVPFVPPTQRRDDAHPTARPAHL